jgi:hypothetical protein
MTYNVAALMAVPSIAFFVGAVLLQSAHLFIGRAVLGLVSAIGLTIVTGLRNKSGETSSPGSVDAP